MPHEPDKTMEELLRALARRRRDSSGPEPGLHPATRRLLHSEVARAQKQGRGSVTWWSCLPVWWGRFAGIAVVLTVLSVGGWLMWSANQREPMRMAKVAQEKA